VFNSVRVVDADVFVDAKLAGSPPDHGLITIATVLNQFSGL
jgi:hypothetical protein